MAKKPVSITKQDPKAVAAELNRRIQVVDEFGQLDAEVKAFAARKKRHESLKDQIRKWADAEFPASDSVTYEGMRYAVEVSAKGNKRTVDVIKAYFLLGKTKFLELCSVTLKAIEDNLAPDDRDKVIVEHSNVGERSVSATQRAVAVQKAA